MHLNKRTKELILDIWWGPFYKVTSISSVQLKDGTSKTSPSSSLLHCASLCLLVIIIQWWRRFKHKIFQWCFQAHTDGNDVTDCNAFSFEVMSFCLLSFSLSVLAHLSSSKFILVHYIGCWLGSIWGLFRWFRGFVGGWDKMVDKIR